MPAAGTTKIPKAKKARILVEKRLKTGDVKAIAKRNKIAPNTVHNISYTKDPEVLALAASFEQRIIAQARTNVEKGLRIIETDILDNPKAPAQARINGMKESHALYRLETNQPTSISQHQRSPLELAIEFAKILLSKHPDPSEAKMLFGYANTARVGIGASEEEWKQVEAQVFA